MTPSRPSFIKLPPLHASLLALPGDAALAERLANASGAKLVPVESHRFPDGETALRLTTHGLSGEVAIVGGLHDPDRATLPLLLLADAARQWGATRVGLVAPYLAYMRQDAALHAGDAITARSFARVLSHAFDWLVTIDPHLHRVQRLAQLYTIPARVLHSAATIGEWIAEHVESPLIVGPDGESRQWAESVAAAADAPWVVLRKTRRGDENVSIALPPDLHPTDRTPVLVDDIISTGTTMAETVRQMQALGFPAPVCVGVHAVFADGAYEGLMAAGARRVVTTNTIAHATNGIDVVPLLAAAVSRRRGHRLRLVARPTQAPRAGPP